MIRGLVTYERSARRALVGLLDGKPHTQLRPGDLVQHALWAGTFGVLVSKVSDEHMTVLWTSEPGQKRQALDRLADALIDSQNPCGEVLLDSD